MKNFHLQKLALSISVLFLMVSCSKDDAADPTSVLPNVTIGNQIWQSTNLDVTTYRDGTPIPQVTDPTQWKNLTTGAWCYYNNDPANGSIYGKLYNSYAVAGIHDNDANTPNKELAPIGWHVPSDAEWTILTDFLGGESVAGGKMKATGTTHWKSPNSDATNSSGFNGHPGGWRTLGTFSHIGLYGHWWSSSQFDPAVYTTLGLFFDLDYNNGNASISSFDYEVGLSVRCIRD
jgi:uncharacterized protein (TIGR02145 family)